MKELIIIIIIATPFAILWNMLEKNNANNGNKTKNTIGNNAEKKVEMGVSEYEEAFAVLPNSLINKIGSTIYKVTSNPNISDEQIPLEIFMAAKAATKVKGNSNRIILTDRNKEREMRKIVESFETNVCMLIGVSKEYTDQAASSGLNFGIVTNSAADMALYSAMNYHEKNKNLRRANMTINYSLKEYVVRLKDDLMKLK